MKLTFVLEKRSQRCGKTLCLLGPFRVVCLLHVVVFKIKIGAIDQGGGKTVKAGSCCNGRFYQY